MAFTCKAERRLDSTPLETAKFNNIGPGSYDNGHQSFIKKQKSM